MSRAALIQVVTVRRPRARTAPRNRRASRGADRRSSAAASRENQWYGARDGCEDIIGTGSGRGCTADGGTAIVPVVPTLVYSISVRWFRSGVRASLQFRKPQTGWGPLREAPR